jgi:hypothetical protein
VKTRVILLFAIVFVLILAGCDEDKTTVDTQKDNSLTTPGLTLHQLELCWNGSLDTSEYSSLLVNDGSYRFNFNPNDVGYYVSGYIIPVYWTKEQDKQSTQKMFTEAHKIELTIVNWQDFNHEVDGNSFTAENCHVQLYLYPESDDFAYLADCMCDFEFVNVDGKWLIKTWSYQNTGAENEPSSLGMLRAVYPPDSR